MPLKRLLATSCPPWARPLAALAAVGMLAVATPLAQWWSLLGTQQRAAGQAQQAVHAVQWAHRTQQALIAHRPFAHAVLSGREAQEVERVRRQAAVDTAMGGLDSVLTQQQLASALREVDELRSGWSELLSGVGARSLNPTASDAAHDLMVEQTIVISDLSAAFGGIASAIGVKRADAELWLLLTEVPRWTAALASAGAATASASPPPLGQRSANADPAEARLQAQAARLFRLVVGQMANHETHGSASDADAFDPVRQGALLSLRQALAPLAAAPWEPREAALAITVANNAQAVLWTGLEQRLGRQATHLQLNRFIAGAALALVLLFGLVVAQLALPRRACQADGSATPPPAHDADAPVAATHPVPLHQSSPSGAESAWPAHELMQRLRQPASEGADASAEQAAGAAPKAGSAGTPGLPLPPLGG